MTDQLSGDLVASHRRTLIRFAATLVPRDEVEDVVQDAMVRAWRKRDAFDPDRGSLRSWLLAILADQARSRWKRRKPATESIIPDILIPLSVSETTLDVRGAVARLAARQRAAVTLFYYVDLSVEDVAVVMGCSVGTVKSTLHDARLELMKTLGSYYVGD